MPHQMPPRGIALPRARRALVLALTTLTALTLTILPATPARADTDDERLLLGWVNEARVERGLVPLVRWPKLEDIAGGRAARMAETNTLSHSVAGSLSSWLAARHVTWYRYGEVIASSTQAWPADSVRHLFDLWRNSPDHWRLLMSAEVNYIGVGLAYRAANHRTFGSIVTTDSPDHTPPVARMGSRNRTGDDVRWTWTGGDVRLQTRTVGLAHYDLQYRVDGGPWQWLRDDTSATAITLVDRVHGHVYALRVRGTDRRGNVGVWSAPSSVTVP